MSKAPSRPFVLRIATLALLPGVALGLSFCSSDYASRGAPADGAAPDVVAVEADGAPADAGIDAGPRGPCVADAGLFCDDFDDPRVGLGDGWALSEITPVATRSHDSELFVSAPRAARFDVVAGSGASFLGRAITLPSPDFRVSFDVRIDVVAPGTFVEVDIFHLSVMPYAADTKQQVFVLAGLPDHLEWGAQRRFGDAGKAYSATTIPLFSLGAWHRCVVTTSRSDAGGGVTAYLSVDDQLPIPATIDFAPAPTGASIEIGAPYVDNASAKFAARFDNVRVESR
ncbi:MAG: hypothetical protein HOO96_28700 [Polyangiaceae bacterium]|nr:hypothetical protein [Polyangiaceae bacterium]